VRSRREATGLFAGNYASAIRGGGLEFEESRPYAPGDDAASVDWNATARTGELFVKRFREERNQTLLFALDTSASMGFGTAGRSKAATAVHALALLAAAAARAGDRTGLVAFDDSLRGFVPAGRGGAHGLRVIHRAVEWGGAPGGETRLAVALHALRVDATRRAVLVLLSDFRAPDLFAPETVGSLAELGRRHDVIAVPILDPAEADLPPVGPIRIVDPERPGAARLLPAGRRSARRRYREESLRWRGRLERELRRRGAEPLWLYTDHSPLHTLGRFFRERAARRVPA
jgi:uncharacterized protein (DUF58 family)